MITSRSHNATPSLLRPTSAEPQDITLGDVVLVLREVVKEIQELRSSLEDARQNKSLGVNEAAKYLGISARRLAQLVALKEVRSRLIGRRRVFLVDELDDFRRKCRG